MHPILLDLGFFQLPTYGLLLATGVVAALWTLSLRADRAGMEGAHLVDFTLWLVIWALVGAKLLLVIVELPRYLRDPASLLGVFRAGGVFLGGFIAAVIAAVVLLRRYKLRALPTFDVITPIAGPRPRIGRIGCLMAGCCWGAACDLPWAITYTDPVAAERLGNAPLSRGSPVPDLQRVVQSRPLPAAGASVQATSRSGGTVFATYLVLYGIGRFALEWTRGDVARGFRPRRSSLHQPADSARDDPDRRRPPHLDQPAQDPVTTRHDLTVAPHLDGLRLDSCIAELVPEWSRSRARKLIDGGHVTVNGEAARPSLKVREGDRYSGSRTATGAPRHRARGHPPRHRVSRTRICWSSTNPPGW